jgi:pyruvate dehydrogenase E1 component beta subunit
VNDDVEDSAAQDSHLDRAAATISMTYREALRDGLRDALGRDERVFLMGEDIGAYGGCFAVSLGLWEEFGAERVRDTPLSESAFVGAGVGAAMGGLRPVVEVMTINFLLLALDQIVNNAATLQHMSGGQFHVPMVIRTTTGAGRQLAAQHSHSLEGWLAHIPGIRVVAPSTVADARGMLWTAIQDPDPVIIVEHGALFGMTAEVPRQLDAVDLDAAAVRRQGSDVTLVAHGASLHVSLSAADVLAEEGVTAEVIDLRTLRPLDMDTILASVARTGRLVVAEDGWRTGGIGAEIAAQVAEAAFWDLDAPVARVASAEVPMPYAQHLEAAAMVDLDDVVAAVLGLLG